MTRTRSVLMLSGLCLAAWTSPTVTLAGEHADANGGPALLAAAGPYTRYDYGYNPGYRYGPSYRYEPDYVYPSDRRSRFYGWRRPWPYAGERRDLSGRSWGWSRRPAWRPYGFGGHAPYVVPRRRWPDIQWAERQWADRGDRAPAWWMRRP